MKVLVLSSMYHKPGGTYAGLAIHRQTVQSVREGAEVRVLCPVPRFSRGALLDPFGRRNPLLRVGATRTDGVHITYLPFPNVPIGVLPGVQSLILGGCIRREMTRIRREFPFELIHAHQLFPAGHVATGMAKRFNVPVVVSAVGSDVHTHPRRNQGILRRTRSAISESDEVTAVSRGLAAQVNRLADTRKPVRVIYRGVDTERFSPVPHAAQVRSRLGLPISGLGICTVGRLVRAKGILELLDAFESLAHRFPDSWLSLVGDGPLKRMVEDRIGSGTLSGRVYMARARPQTEVAEWMNAADVFALASHAEGLPNVVLEAMACACPVVATDVGGVSEAVEDGETGILVPKENGPALAEALSRLLTSEGLRRRMGEAGRRRVLSSFSWQRNGAEILRLYGEVLGRGPEEGRHEVRREHRFSPVSRASE